MSKEQSLKDTLVEARSLIQDVGWTQGTYATYAEGNKVIGYCALGALSATHAGPEIRHDAIMRLSKQTVQYNGSDIVSYNDAEGRTKEEVLAVFDQAIESVTNE